MSSGDDLGARPLSGPAILARLLPIDGAGSALDADFVRGLAPGANPGLARTNAAGELIDGSVENRLSFAESAIGSLALTLLRAGIAPECDLSEMISDSSAPVVVQDSLFSIANVIPGKRLAFDCSAQQNPSLVTIRTGAQTADRTLSLPVLTGNDTLAALNVANIFGQKNSIDLGSGVQPSGITPDALNLYAADGASIRMAAGTWGSASGTVHFARNAGGTRLVPAATASGSTIIGQGGSGHDGTTYTGSRGYAILAATSLWTGSSHETSWQWATTKAGATSQAERMRLTTNLLVGTATDIAGDGGLKVAGIVIAAQGQGWGVTSTATAAGTTTLTTASTVVQKFTGTTTQTVQLPAANALGAGIAVVYVIKNRSTGTVTIQRAGADTIDGSVSVTLAGSANLSYTLVSDGVSEWSVVN